MHAQAALCTKMYRHIVNGANAQSVIEYDLIRDLAHLAPRGLHLREISFVCTALCNLSMEEAKAGCMRWQSEVLMLKVTQGGLREVHLPCLHLHCVKRQGE